MSFIPDADPAEWAEWDAVDEIMDSYIEQPPEGCADFTALIDDQPMKAAVFIRRELVARGFDKAYAGKLAVGTTHLVAVIDAAPTVQCDDGSSWKLTLGNPQLTEEILGRKITRIIQPGQQR